MLSKKGILRLRNAYVIGYPPIPGSLPQGRIGLGPAIISELAATAPLIPPPTMRTRMGPLNSTRGAKGRATRFVTGLA